MIKRNQIAALGGIIAIAGCSGGGSKAAVPTTNPAQAVKRPLLTGHITINPTLLRHAKSKRRRPAFIDLDGDFSPIVLQISSITNDGTKLSPALTTVSVGSDDALPETVNIPLYGPGGFIRIQNYSLPNAPALPQLLADTDSNSDSGVSFHDGFGNVQYSVAQGQDSAISISQNFSSFSTAPVTLNAVLGAIAFDDTPDGSDSPTTASPVADGSRCMPINSAQSLFLFPADAAGNFATVTAIGGFTNPVTYVPGSGVASGDVALVTTNVQGVYKFFGFGSFANAEFQSSDIFGNTVNGFITLDSTGYICSAG